MKQLTKPFALCLDNADDEASLARRKMYRLLPKARAAKEAFVRIIDESGKDDLFHKSHFVFVDFPSAVKKKILALESLPSFGASPSLFGNGLPTCRTFRLSGL